MYTLSVLSTAVDNVQAMQPANLSKSGQQSPRDSNENGTGTLPKCSDNEDTCLRMKFQKLVVSTTSCSTSICKKSVIKSEQEVTRLRVSSSNLKNKAVLRKSKLADTLKKFRTPSDLHTAIEDSRKVTTSEDPKVFGRKFSFSLESFSSLSIGEKNASEEKDDTISYYEKESFKSISVSNIVYKLDFFRTTFSTFPIFTPLPTF